MPHRTTRRLFAFFLAATTLFFSGCAAMRTASEPPEVNLTNLQIQDVTLSHVNMVAELRLFNPNPSALKVERVDYTLQLKGVKMFTGHSLNTVSVPANDYGFVALRLSSAYWDILSFLNRMETSSEVDYILDGSVQTGGYGPFGRSFPFRKEGVIPLERLPEAGRPLSPGRQF